jgi:hypothetical protein
VLPRAPGGDFGNVADLPLPPHGAGSAAGAGGASAATGVDAGAKTDGTGSSPMASGSAGGGGSAGAFGPSSSGCVALRTPAQLGLQPVVDASTRGASCEYALPADAAPYLPDQLNLELTRDATTTRVARVSDASACDPLLGGWYYDDPRSPTRMLACEQSCTQAGSDGQVQLVFGCSTVTRP